MDQEVMNQLSTEVLRLDTRIDNVSDDLEKLDKKVDSINNDAINQRVNDIANVVDNNTSAVNALTNRVSALENNDELSQEISDVADDVKGLHDANDKINTTIGDLSNIIDGHSSRIKELENQTKQTAQEVAVRAAKSVTRSIENSEMQEIHEEIHEVAMAVDNLDASVSPKVRTLENQAYDFHTNIVNLHKEDKDIWDAMENMDVEHHEELHRLALAIDNHDSSISLLYNRTDNFIEATNNHLERLDAEDASIWKAMEEMDVEHHEELHLLTKKIDAHDVKIAAQDVKIAAQDEKIDAHDVKIADHDVKIAAHDEKIRIQNEKIDSQDASINLLKIHGAEQDTSINQIIAYNNVQDASINSNTNRIQTLENTYVPHVVLTEEEYEDLENPDASTFYFTYEDD